MPPYQSRK